MREIKFRAWNAEEKQMTNFDLFCLEDGFADDVDLLKCEIMQFTGLHDKDGREIYEGDIVVFLSSHQGRVVYEAGAFRVKGNRMDGPKFSWCIGSEAKRFEVIGNVYEHPDLVKP